MSNNFSNPQSIKDSEQHRPIAKLQFSEGKSKPKSQSSSSNNSSQKNE